MIIAKNNEKDEHYQTNNEHNRGNETYDIRPFKEEESKRGPGEESEKDDINWGDNSSQNNNSNKDDRSKKIESKSNNIIQSKNSDNIHEM